jgi:hypothetical protein
MRFERLLVRISGFQTAYSAKDSRAFQSATRSMAVTDWVMVCSSTLRASAVTHSTKRRWLGRVKAEPKGWSNRCQSDQMRVACRMGHLRLRCLVGFDHLAGSAREMPHSRDTKVQMSCWIFQGNYCLKRASDLQRNCSGSPDRTGHRLNPAYGVRNVLIPSKSPPSKTMMGLCRKKSGRLGFESRGSDWWFRACPHRQRVARVGPTRPQVLRVRDRLIRPTGRKAPRGMVGGPGAGGAATRPGRAMGRRSPPLEGVEDGPRIGGRTRS